MPINMTDDFYSLEKPIVVLKERIDALLLAGEPGAADEVAALRREIETEWGKIQPDLSPTQIVQIARHPKRPYTLDYIKALTQEFLEMHGDRRFADDPAIVAGFAFYKGSTIAIIGHQKGRTTRERIERNFGQMNPEGYRKALRVMKLAEKYGFPVVSFIDTPGAYPGIGAEERGQAESIARNLREMTLIEVPIVIVIIGEGASGGALGIGLGDRVYMMENSWYSVISPEGCAAILWRDAAKAPDAAEALKLTATDVQSLGLIDGIIPEPVGGAHRDPQTTANSLKACLLGALEELDRLSPEERISQRIQKYRRMGVYDE